MNGGSGGQGEPVRRGRAPDVEGWKAIAAAIGRSERSARSYRDLPVYSFKGRVVAYRDELAAWVLQHLSPRTP